MGGLRGGHFSDWGGCGDDPGEQAGDRETLFYERGAKNSFFLAKLRGTGHDFYSYLDKKGSVFEIHGRGAAALPFLLCAGLSGYGYHPNMGSDASLLFYCLYFARRDAAVPLHTGRLRSSLHRIFAGGVRSTGFMKKYVHDADIRKRMECWAIQSVF